MAFSMKAFTRPLVLSFALALPLAACDRFDAPQATTTQSAAEAEQKPADAKIFAKLKTAIDEKDLQKLKSLTDDTPGSPEVNQALHYAIEKNQRGAVEVLIKAKAHVNRIIRDDKSDFADGVTPLARAATNGSDDIVALLLSNGAEVDRKTADGYTPLSNAAEQGRLPVVERLINAGADINAQNTKDGKEGCTPIMWATLNGHEDVVRLLIRYKADLTLKANSGTSVFDIAASLEDDKLTKTLDAAKKGAVASAQKLDRVEFACGA